MAARRATPLFRELSPSPVERRLRARPSNGPHDNCHDFLPLPPRGEGERCGPLLEHVPRFLPLTMKANTTSAVPRVDPTDRLLTTAQVAELLGLEARTIKEKCAAGVVRSAVKIGREWRVPASRIGEAALPLKGQTIGWKTALKNRQKTMFPFDPKRPRNARFQCMSTDANVSRFPLGLSFLWQSNAQTKGLLIRWFWVRVPVDPRRS